MKEHSAAPISWITLLGLALVLAPACQGGDCSASASDWLQCWATDGISLDVAFDGQPAAADSVQGGFSCGEDACLREASVSAGHLGLDVIFNGVSLPLGETPDDCEQHQLSVDVELAEVGLIAVGSQFDLGTPDPGVTVVSELWSMYGCGSTGGGSVSPTAVYRVTAGTVTVTAAGADGWAFQWHVTLARTSAPVEGVPELIELSNVRLPCSVEESSGC